MKQFILFILILLFGCTSSNYTDKSSIGEFLIVDKYFKDLKGGAELNFRVFNFDSNLVGGCLIIIDNKFIRFTNNNGELSINLKNKDCFTLRIFSINKLMFESDKLCFDSNTVTKGEIYLEFPIE